MYHLLSELIPSGIFQPTDHSMHFVLSISVCEWLEHQ